MKLWIVGSKGMLGSAVMNAAKHQLEAEAVEAVENFQPDAGSVVVNCAGAIPNGRRQGHRMVHANAVLPFLLAEKCQEAHARLIHVSTDCVFSGSNKLPISYVQSPDPYDIYGRSKALGEEIAHVFSEVDITVVRTSFVGLQHGLLKWLIEHNGQTVDGYERVLWSGSTVWEVAQGIIEIIQKPRHYSMEHLATREVWNKYQVLMRLKEILDLKVEIMPVQAPVINRALVPTTVIRDLNDKFVATRLFEEWMK